jgi:phage/plasmid-like protein (TIGR03299 family)
MAHMVESMAYAGEVPWHGLGNKVDSTMSPEEMMVAAGIDWTVSKRPAYVPTVGHVTNLYDPTGTAPVQLVPETNFIVRDTDNTVLSVCGSTYVPFQNADVMGFFKKFTDAGHMDMDTAGSLKGGKEVWGLAKIRKGFKLAGGDEVDGYLMLNNSHVPGKAMTIQFTAVRVVCWNTLSQALQGTSAAVKAGRGFKVPHMQMFDAEIKLAAEQALGLSTEQIDHFKQQAEFLASAKSFDVDKWIAELLQPNLLIERAKSNNPEALPPLHEQFARTAVSVREAIETSPGADLPSARGTWWGALNGLTYAVDHKKGGNALHSAWFGSGAALKREGLEKALEFAR